jgi:hypothetical protein
MKKFLFLLLIAVSFTACEDPVHEEYSLYEDQNSSAIFKADIDGQTWDAPISIGYIENGVISITGLDANTGKSITITLQASGTGTYTLDYEDAIEGSYGLAYNPYLNPPSSYLATNLAEPSSGEVVISEIDETNKTFSGTFNAVAYTGDEQSFVTITNGIFSNVPYENEFPPNEDNSFYAKVDGEEFVENSVNGALTTLSDYSSIAITAVKNNLETIGITIPLSLSTPGTYTNFSAIPVQDVIVGQYNLSSTEFYSSQSGSITITLHDTDANRIEGTFNFVAVPYPSGGTGYEITEGSFGVTYTE